MARRRSLHPNFFHDEVLVTLPPLYRILFEGLWCLADREGILEDRPVRIKMKVLPMDTIDVDEALDVLQVHGMVLRYAVEGRRYLKVVNFLRFQHPHPSEAPSVFPGPDSGNGRESPAVDVDGNPGGIHTGTVRSENAIRTGVRPSDTQAFGVRTPQTPLRGAIPMRPAQLRRRAEHLRAKVYFGCPHNPKCAGYGECITLIVDELRAEVAVATKEARA